VGGGRMDGQGEVSRPGAERPRPRSRNRRAVNDNDPGSDASHDGDEPGVDLRRVGQPAEVPNLWSLRQRDPLVAAALRPVQGESFSSSALPLAAVDTVLRVTPAAAAMPSGWSRRSHPR
jgi:hypothetical protein